LTRATKRLVYLGRGLVSVVVLDKLDINWLIGSDAHQVQRSTTLSDHLEISSILRVVEAAERSIFNAETILPEM
jgi:hypothetical protein